MKTSVNFRGCTAYVLRAGSRFVAKNKSDSTPPVTMTPHEIATAEKRWISHTQNKLVLQKDSNVLKSQLGLFRDREDCGDVVVNFKVQTFPLWPNTQSCCPEGIISLP